jgi:transcriptional regulator with XRE-family HTH domain
MRWALHPLGTAAIAPGIGKILCRQGRTAWASHRIEQSRSHIPVEIIMPATWAAMTATGHAPDRVPSLRNTVGSPDAAGRPGTKKTDSPNRSTRTTQANKEEREDQMKARSFYIEPVAAKPRHERKVIRDTAGKAINSHVARQIKYLRVVNGKTQTEIGEIIGMTFQQVAKYEKGISKIPPDKLWMLSDYFGVEINYFFDGVEQISEENRLDCEPVTDDRTGDKRLRLELANAIQKTQSTKVLRSLLGFLRVACG